MMYPQKARVDNTALKAHFAVVFFFFLFFFLLYFSFISLMHVCIVLVFFICV